MSWIPEALKLEKPVPCGNPKILATIGHPNRSISKDWLKAIERDGKKFCAWCNVNELTGSRKKYCSDDCSNSSSAYCYPQNNEYAFRFLMIRQNFSCAGCGFSYEEAYADSQKWILRLYRRDILRNIKYIKDDIPRYRSYRGNNEKLDDLDAWEKSCREEISVLLKQYFDLRKKESDKVWTFRTSDRIRAYHRKKKDHKAPEIDHIIPVKLDGMAIGFDNVQILCYSCHKIKTAKDNREIREYKKGKQNVCSSP